MNSTHKGKATQPAPSYAGKWKVTSTDKSDGVIKDVDRPATYPQIGPNSKTGFGSENENDD